MTRHLVLTENDTTPDEIRDALEAAGIAAQAKAIHLQRAAKLVAAVISEYPASEQSQALETVRRWIDDSLEGHRGQSEGLAASD